MIHFRGKVFYPVSFCGASVQWSVYAAIPFHSNLSHREKTYYLIYVWDSCQPPRKYQSLQKNAIHNISSVAPQKMGGKSQVLFICSVPLPIPKKHRKVPPEEQVAFNVMEAHSTGRLAKGAVGIQGGNG